MATRLSGGGGQQEELDPRLVALLANLQQQQGQEEAQAQGQGMPRTAPFGMQAGPSLDLLKVLSKGVGMPTEMAGAPTPAQRARVTGDAGLLPRSSQRESLPDVGRSRQQAAMQPPQPIGFGAVPGSSITPEVVRALLQQQEHPSAMAIPGMVTPPTMGNVAMPSMSILPQGGGSLLTQPTMSLPAAQQMLAQSGGQGMVTPPSMPALISQGGQPLITPAAQGLIPQGMPLVQGPQGTPLIPQGQGLPLTAAPPMAPVQGFSGQGGGAGQGPMAMLSPASMPTMTGMGGMQGMADMLGGGGVSRGTSTGGQGGAAAQQQVRAGQGSAASAAGGGIGGLLGLLNPLLKLGANYLNKPFNQVDLMSMFAPAAGTVGGGLDYGDFGNYQDLGPLGTGALTNTAPDILRPIFAGESAPQDYPNEWEGPTDTGTEPSSWDFGDAGDTGDTGIEPSSWDFSSGGDSGGDLTGFDPSNVIDEGGGGFDLGDFLGSFDRGVGGMEDIGDIGGAAGGGWSLGDMGLGDLNVGDVTPYLGGALNLGTSIMNEDPIGAVKGAASLAGAAGVPYAGLVPSLMDLGAGIASGDAAGMVRGGGNLVSSALSSSGLFTGGAMLPVAAWATVLTNILADELNDPKGSVSAAQDANYLNQQGMKGWIGQLKDVHTLYPSLNENLSDEDAQDLYKRFRLAAKADQLMADPMAMQGQNEAGVQMTNFGPAVANLREIAGPEAVRGTLFLQDLLTRRGIEMPELETATALQRQMQQFREGAANQPGAGGEYTSQYAGMPSLFSEEGNLAPLSPLRPDEALGMLGFNQANLAAPENTAQLMQQYGVTSDEPMPEALRRAYEYAGQGQTPTRNIYSPDVMEQLYALEPGDYETGLLRILGGMG